MELEGWSSSRAVRPERCIRFDGDTCRCRIRRPLDMHLLGRQLNIVTARLLDDGIANVFFRIACCRSIASLQS